MVDWQTFLHKGRSFVWLEEKFGVPHEIAAIMTWVDSVDVDGNPAWRVLVDHPVELSPTPTSVIALPDTAQVRIVNASDVHVPGAKIERYARVGGVFNWEPITKRSWSAGDLAIIVVVATQSALDDMLDPAKRMHLPLMRKWCNTDTPDNPTFDPQAPFTQAHVGIINTWFGALGTNGNPKYTNGLTATQVAGFFGQYVPEVTGPTAMADWMKANPRYMTIATFADVFEDAI